ncbi:MAG: hypothetical protein JRD03_02120 [Deltaproteobacteria bacterium]|nr:hypothetical protein [Deltaproteobacteria bacterium]
MSQLSDSRRVRAGLRRVPKRGLCLAIFVALSGFFQVPAAAARDVVRVESVGVAPVRSDSVSSRDAAVRKGLLEAVRQTAEELLATGMGDEFGDPEDLEAAEAARAELHQILGNKPLDYATRFQVVEDRGEGPALFSSDPDAETEYVVIVSVFVDRDRIRERLTRAGVILAPAGQEPQIQSRLILEEIGQYWAYAEIRRVLLEELKMHSATPRAFSPGLAILELNAAQSPSEYLPSLQRSVSGQMDLVLLSVEADEMRLRVEIFDRPPPGEVVGEGEPIDTLSPNRY